MDALVAVLLGLNFLIAGIAFLAGREKLADWAINGYRHIGLTLFPRTAFRAIVLFLGVFFALAGMVVIVVGAARIS